MNKSTPEKLAKIVKQIEEAGSATLTKLTVLKKWFEKPSRISSFAIFIAIKAYANRNKEINDSIELYKAANELLKNVDLFKPDISNIEAEKLYIHLKKFQSEYKGSSWEDIRVINDMNLFLIEEGLRIYLWSLTPSSAYRLAANYCEHYDSRYGNALSGPSYKKIKEIIDFVNDIEKYEENS